jgi:hypothetical protein
MILPFVNRLAVQSKITEHLYQQAGADFLLAVFHRSKPVPIVKSAMTAFALTGLKTNLNAMSSSGASDTFDKFRPVHDDYVMPDKL